jgi:hypothetical protein
MPYTKEELENLEFYQNLARRDEIKYSQMIQKRIEFAASGGGPLRDSKSGNIILFERIIPGQGIGGRIAQSYSEGGLHTIELPEDAYFDYLEGEELNKIIDREFTEF